MPGRQESPDQLAWGCVPTLADLAEEASASNSTR